MKTVLKYMRPHLAIFLWCVFLKVFAAIADLQIPRMLAVIIDEDIPSGDVTRVYRTGAIMILFALTSLASNIAGNRISAHAVARFSRDLRRDLFVATMNLDTRSTDKFGLSSLTSRLTSDTYNVALFFGRLARMGMRAPMILVGGIITAFTLDYRLALLFVVVLPLVFGTVTLITARAMPLYKKEQKTLDALVRRVDETSSGIRVIKALSKVEYEKNKFNETAKNLSDDEIKAGRVTSLTTPINDLIFYLGFSGVVVLGAVITARYGEEMSGTLLAFMTYFTMILNSMLAMSRIFVQMSRAMASSDRIAEIFDEKSEMTVSAEEERDETAPFISFESVTFSYNGVAPNLKDISFSLERGKTLGIIGGTGSGKSTLVNLLVRLYDPTEGRIRIDGRDLRAIPKEELHAMFGIAYQNDFIPRGSVAENIDFYRGIEEGELVHASEIARAAEFIAELDGGMQYEVDTRGANLSGGQRQRLIISRAVAGSPAILILDDSSSALDYKTDKELRTAIRRDIDTTTVIVSQRVASVRAADLILVLDNGEIIGKGTHEELMKTVPEYRDIAAVQMEVSE